MFIESIRQDIPLGEEIIADLILFAAYVLADGLLVWRCFHSSGRSFRRTLIPISLFTVETVLSITVTAYICLGDAKPNFESAQTDKISNRLNGAAFISVAATSLVSTLMICRQIWRHTSTITRSRKHYRTIIDILIQSSALLTVTVILSAILNFINTGNIESSLKISFVTQFVSAFDTIIPVGEFLLLRFILLILP
ncbi:hypothetical protein CPC08DRAFT_715698 [Agrocybe pediades]|nr:hypothetical protein CPC08DRAFT_715698 [Agrocybe pediades]